MKYWGHPRCRSMLSRSCQPGISRMSKRPTIDSSLYTLEDRISVLIHCKLEKETENKITAGRPNCLLQAAYTENEKATVLKNRERNKDNLNVFKFTRLIDDICSTEQLNSMWVKPKYMCVCLSFTYTVFCLHAPGLNVYTHTNTHTHVYTHRHTHTHTHTV